ncbi:MAG: glutathione S-transferase family protein [Pseudomonadota bacterium]
MKLYFAPNSRAVRVAWCLEEMGLDYDLHSFTLGHPDMRAQDYREVHPMGRVPALELDDGRVIFESGAIIQYLLTTQDTDLVPDPATEAFTQYLQWFHYAEGMIMPPINTYVVETVLLPPERRTEVNVKRSAKLLNQMLTAVEAHMADRDWLAGPFSAAEFMTGHAVIAASTLGGDFSDKPNLTAYVDRMLARPALQKARSL